ncbi:MAG: intradiol ring-cleavage dioxygenase [Runella slithyformis]|nr:MAG: intradiol ring-cleavage dioxygenase [Runella slithyformis]
MKRIEFLKSLGLGFLTSTAVAACASTDTATPDAGSTTTTGSTNGSSASDCTTTPAETAGPFPTKSPSGLVKNDIRSDRSGLMMTTAIAIKNKNASCAALKDAIVDIWHCDADGSYSEYANYTSVSFLRGRQTTDANGLVTFTSIFPGWYGGRAPHIHVHVYNASGKSLLVTQIAFPKTVCDTVYGTANTFYKKGLQDTTNERDNVFRDGFATEMAALTGSVKDGYALTHTIVVNA